MCDSLTNDEFFFNHFQKNGENWRKFEMVLCANLEILLADQANMMMLGE